MTPKRAWILTAIIALPLALCADEARVETSVRSVDETTLAEWTQEGSPAEEGMILESSYLPPTYLDLTCYFTRAVKYDGSEIELNDGSVWAVSSWNRAHVLSFDTSDPLYLTPNSGWFSTDGFLLVNENKGCSLPVIFQQPPLLNTPCTYQIVSLELNNRMISLSNGQTIIHWDVKPSDFGMFAQFKVGDYVLLGRTSGFRSWMSRPYSDLIINIAMQGLPYVRVHQL